MQLFSISYNTCSHGTPCTSEATASDQYQVLVHPVPDRHTVWGIFLCVRASDQTYPVGEQWRCFSGFCRVRSWEMTTGLREHPPWGGHHGQRFVQQAIYSIYQNFVCVLICVFVIVSLMKLRLVQISQECVPFGSNFSRRKYHPSSGGCNGIERFICCRLSLHQHR